MPQLFDTYSSDYRIQRLKDGRPMIIPSGKSEAINKSMAILHRDLQIVKFISPLVGSMFEIGCDAGHLLALAEYYGVESYGIDIDKGSIKSCLSNGINAAYGDLEILVNPSIKDAHHNTIHSRAIHHELIAFLNFSHVAWHGERQIIKERLFAYAANNFKYILCSAYDSDIELLEKIYNIRLIHNFSNWREEFNRSDNLAVQYDSKKTTCCLETYLNLQKLFISCSQVATNYSTPLLTS